MYFRRGKATSYETSHHIFSGAHGESPTAIFTTTQQALGN